MNDVTRVFVRERANDECEYCGLKQDDVPFVRFHVDHIISKQHGGTDDLANLAQSCPQCNAYKGTNIAAIDPESGQAVTLYNPRTQRWFDHFTREGPRIVGLTPEGRTTARLLSMNSIQRLELRAALDP